MSEMHGRLDGQLVLAACTQFDAVILPRLLGTVVLAQAEPTTPPSIISGSESVTVLVRAGTGHVLSTLAALAQLRRGSAGQILLPPSPGQRWDSLPWDPATGTLTALPDGASLVKALQQALRICPPSREG